MRNITVKVSNDLSSEKKETRIKNSGRKVIVDTDGQEMGRGDSNVDLRAKLDRKKDYGRNKEVVDLNSSRDSNHSKEIWTDKENSRRNRSRTRSKSRSRSRRKRHRSRTRSWSRSKRERRRVRTRSRSEGRKPLSEQKLRTPEIKEKDKSRKRPKDEETSPRKSKQTKKLNDPSVDEKPKKKKKDGDEKLKKKKKKKDKDKEKKSKKNKNKQATEQNDGAEPDPKSRKERIDSGISTCSQINGESSQSVSQKKESKAVSRVSDSPLSGPSLSPSPPPNRISDLSTSLTSMDTNDSKDKVPLPSHTSERNADMNDFPKIEALNGHGETFRDDLWPSKDHTGGKSHTEERDRIGDTRSRIPEDSWNESDDRDIRGKSRDRDARISGNRSSRDHSRDRDVRKSREKNSRPSSRERDDRPRSRDGRPRDPGTSMEREVIERGEEKGPSELTYKQPIVKSQDGDRGHDKEFRNSRDRDGRSSQDREIRKSRDKDRRSSREREIRTSRDRDGRSSRDMDLKNSRDKEDGKRDSRAGSRERDLRGNSRDGDLRDSRTRKVRGRDSRDLKHDRSPDRNRRRFDRRDRSRERRDYRDAPRERPHMRRGRRDRTPPRQRSPARPPRVLTPTISQSRKVMERNDNVEDQNEAGKIQTSLERSLDNNSPNISQEAPNLTPTRPRSPSKEVRRSRDRDYRVSPRRYDRSGRRSPPRRRDSYNSRDYDSRYNRRYSHDDDREYGHRYSRRYSSDIYGQEQNSWESKVDDFMSRIGVTTSNLREVPREDPSYPPLFNDYSRPPPTHVSMLPDQSGGYPSYDSVAPAQPLTPTKQTYLPPIEEYPAVGHTSVSPTMDDPSLIPATAAQPDVGRSTEGYPSPTPNQAASERSSLEKEVVSKPLTAKEKKIQDTMQREIWQYVTCRVMSDPFFVKRRKKKGDEEDEESCKKAAEKCVARIAQKLERAGFKEARLWSIMKDNEKGVEGFMDAMKCHLVEGFIQVERDSKKPKDKLEKELLDSGNFFRYAGDFIHKSLTGKVRNPSSSSIDDVPTSVLQNILQTAYSLPVESQQENVTAATTTVEGSRSSAGSPVNSVHDSFRDLKKFMSVKMVETLKVEVETARETAALYVETLAVANFDMASLENAVRNFVPPEPEFEDEPKQTVYGYLLEILRDIPFDKYPRKLSNSNLDAHQTNIVRITLEYFSREKSPDAEPAAQQASSVSARTVGEEEDGFIGPLPPTEEIPVGGNTEGQLPQRRYIMVYVAVDTVNVDGRQIAWQVSVHIPGLPEDEDPDYECLMVPNSLVDRPQIMAELGFTYDEERRIYYHHGTEFGRRKAEMEEVSLEKFANFLDEVRSGLKGAGTNNGLVLVFETGEDLAVIQNLFNTHKHNVFYDSVKGLCCLDHYLRVTRSAKPAYYSWPAYTYKAGDDGGRWISTVTRESTQRKAEALTKPECIYAVTQELVGTVPTYLNFTKWYCYPVQHPEVAAMTAVREHILELLPLQNYVDRQLFSSRVDIALEGVYAVRGQVDANRAYSTCARQVIRRLVDLGFTHQVLMKSFQSDPGYEIPSTVFLQDMSEVEKLRVHEQTDQIRGIIKHWYIQRINPAAALQAWNK